LLLPSSLLYLLHHFIHLLLSFLLPLSHLFLLLVHHPLLFDPVTP